MQLHNPVARTPQIIGEDLLLLFTLIFRADARRLELTGGHERGRPADVEVFGVDGDAQVSPPAPKLGRDSQADHPTADHRDGRATYLALQGGDVVGDDAGASEAARDPGAAVSVVVN